MKVKSLFNRIYFNSAPLTPEDYVRSRSWAIAEASSARVIFTLTSGAFLAGFASHLGADDQFNGILGAVPALAGFIQVVSPMVFEKLERRKFLISALCLLHRLLLGLMVFIPLFISSSSTRLAVLFVVYLVSYTSVSFINPPVSGWIIDLTPENIRGRYFGLRETYALASVTISSLVLGKVLDLYRQSGREYTGFLVVFLIVLVLAIANFVFLSMQKEPAVRRNSIPLDLKSIITTPLKDRHYRKVVILFFIWNVAFQVAGPFFSVYMVTGLKLEYTYIMIMSMISICANMAVVRLWGKLADKRSWILTTKLSIALLAVCHTMWAFIDMKTYIFLMPLSNIVAGVAWAGIGISLFSIQFMFSPEDGRTVYVGFGAALGGIVGFASSLLGSVIVGALAALKFNFLGIIIGNMQVVFFSSGILLIVCAAYIHYFIKKPE